MKKSVLFLLIVCSILLAACGGTSTPAPSAEPVTNTVDATVVAEGILVPDPSVELSFAQPGMIAEVLVAEGDSVTEGQVIARLQNIEVMQAEIAHAEEAFLMAEQAFNSSEAMALKHLANTHAILREAQRAFDNFDIPSDLRQMGTNEALAYTYAQLEAARADFEPYKYLEEQLERELARENPQNPEVYRNTAKLYKQRLDDAWADYRKAIQWAQLEADLEIARANVVNAQNEFDQLTAGEDSGKMAIARAQFETARANLEAARAALANYELRAPFAATILGLDISVGETVNAGFPVAFLGDASHWQVETKDLAEVDVANILIGDVVTVKLDAFPGEEFSGRVTAIDAVGREYLGDMTYKVTITLDTSDPRFRWNMTATVTIVNSDRLNLQED